MFNVVTTFPSVCCQVVASASFLNLCFPDITSQSRIALLCADFDYISNSTLAGRSPSSGISCNGVPWSLTLGMS